MDAIKSDHPLTAVRVREPISNTIDPHIPFYAFIVNVGLESWHLNVAIYLQV